jgi:hypothetical protein
MAINSRQVSPIVESVQDLRKHIADNKASYTGEESKLLLAYEHMQPADQKNVEAALHDNQSSIMPYIDSIATMAAENYAASVASYSPNADDINKTKAEIKAMALEAATWTLNLSGDMKAYGVVASESMASMAGDITVAGDNPWDVKYVAEAFDNSTAMPPDYIASLAVFNAQSVFTDPMQAVFFPPTMVNPGVSGLRRRVRITRVYTPTVRPTFAGTWELVRRKITDAITDPAFLNYPVVKVLPIARAENAQFLVDPNVIPVLPRSLEGELVDTLPIKFDTDVNLISLSILPSQLQQNQIWDETDSLSNQVNLGDIYYKVTVTDANGTAKSVIYRTNLNRQQGSWLIPRIDGNPFDLQTLCTAYLTISNNSVPVIGDHVGLSTSVRSVLGITAAEDFKITSTVELTARCNIEEGNYNSGAGTPKVKEVVIVGGPGLDNTVVDPALYKSSIVIEAIGCYPEAQKTNNNLRRSGIMIDNNVETAYLFNVLPLDPISAKLPMDISTLNTEEVVTRFEDLATVHRLRAVGTSVEKIQELINELRTGDTFPSNSSYIALEWGVKPLLVEREIDINAITQNIASVGAMADVSSALINTITAIVNQMLEDSHYAAILQAICGNNEAYTIIVSCGSTIFPYLKIDGDPRTFGNKRPYQIVQSYHKDMKDKIWISFKTNLKVDGGHDLDFGMRLLKPAYTFDLPIQENGSRYRRLQLVAVEKQYVKLPVFAVLTVKNMLSFFTQKQ